jgi:hypothetical protein
MEAISQSYVVRPNNVFGQPDSFSRGQIITQESNGTISVRPEGMFGGESDFMSRGQIITPQTDGSYKVQQEGIFKGQPNLMDNGYTIYPNR